MKKLIFLFMMIYAQLNAQDLRTQLEVSYKAFTEAVKAKDAQKLKSTLSTSAYINIKNQLLSSGAKFPDDFFQGADEMQTNLNKLIYIKAVSNGPSAYCVYWGKDTYEETNLYIFKFLEENKTWKFNMMSEEGSEELTKKLNAKDFSFLSGKKYQPDGILPPIPKEISSGDYKAVIDISASGYEVEVSINGNLQKKTSSGSYSGLIMGGLKKGTNSVEIIIISKLKDSNMLPVSVTVRALIKEQEKEVFSYKEKNPQSVTKEFVVD